MAYRVRILLLIQVVGRSGAGAAQPSMTASKAVLKRMSKWLLRIVFARLRETWKPSSGMTPRISGSTQKSSGSSAESAIGNRPME
ncbi:hypothetical protein D3C72_2027660 [compost metagenome]